MTLSKMAINARLGDGCIGGSKTAYVSFISTDKSLLQHKERLLISEGYNGIVWGTQKSGYEGKGERKTIYTIRSKAHEKVNEVRDAPIEYVLSNLSEEDLILWYLDDGSWHVNVDTMHLYSNMLDAEQTQILIDKVKQLYGVAPRIQIDRKHDGRSFYYLYFPRELVVIFRPIVRQYLIENSLVSLYYKIGGIEYEDKPLLYLSEDVIRNIRALGKEGVPLVEIAAKNNLKVDRVRRIISRKTYANVI